MVLPSRDIHAILAAGHSLTKNAMLRYVVEAIPRGFSGHRHCCTSRLEQARRAPKTNDGTRTAPPFCPESPALGTGDERTPTLQPGLPIQAPKPVRDADI